MDPRLRSREVLLAWINHRLEVISEAQHRLALDRVVLQEQATRLRLGTPPADVELAFRRAGLRTSLRDGRALGLRAARRRASGP